MGLCCHELDSLKAENARFRAAVMASACSCTCITHESDWSQGPRFKDVCLFIKRLRQSGEPMDGPGEQLCEKKTCTRCAAIDEAMKEGQ